MALEANADISPPSIPASELSATGNGEEKVAEPVVLKPPIDVRSVALSVLAVLGLIFLLKHAQDLFIPTFLAILIAYALDPVVTWVTWLRIPRVVAATIVVLGLLVGLGFGVYAIRHQAFAAIESLPIAAQKL